MSYKIMKQFKIYLEGKGIPLAFLTVGEYALLWNIYRRTHSA